MRTPTTTTKRPYPRMPHALPTSIKRTPDSRVAKRTGLTMLLASTFFLAAASLIASPAKAQQLDTTLFRAMKVRGIGPAGMSGRVTAIDAIHRNPDVIYVGTASGGLWKSTSGGVDWDPIFTDQPTGSIGSISIFQANPDIIWVGAGEGNPRNSQSAGNGVYRTLDGGRSWQHMGLDNTRNIHRIIVDPRDANTVYVGAQGSAWGEHPERGVFKTTDGGETWEKILYVDEKTGVGEMVMDPSNPNKLFVNMWEFRRWPWFFKSGGPGSGLFMTVDGGENWTQLAGKRGDENEDDARGVSAGNRTVTTGLTDTGLPKGEVGRMGLAVAASNPDYIYALVESKKNALYRSTDGGYSWQKRADSGIGGRPFYYAEIHVDLQNENRVYNLHTVVDVSEDGGRTFSNLIPYNDVHPDHHAWWIHPDNPDLIMEGNDGGMAISQDRGETWRHVENLPLAQFYHINVDMDIPYNVYGGMQDNGSWRGAEPRLAKRGASATPTGKRWPSVTGST